MSKSILVVDDEQAVAFFLAEALSELNVNYQTETACSGEEALEKMASDTYDLVVTDLRMPGLDGMDLLSHIQIHYPGTPLILMTAYGDARTEAAARRLGARHYITKPFSIEELAIAVSAALAERQSRDDNLQPLPGTGDKEARWQPKGD